MMNSQIAALRIGRGLTASELGIDGLLAELGKLACELATARVETAASVVTGHRAMARVVAAQAKVIEARSDLIRAHEDLRRIAETADMPTDCPDEAFTGAEIDDATRVAA